MEAFPAAHGGEEYIPSLEEDPALGLSHREKMEILFAVMLGLFLGALDQTIVGPALPTIVTQLSGNDYYVWAITIYLLTSTISVPFWGKLSDVYGRNPNVPGSHFIIPTSPSAGRKTFPRTTLCRMTTRS